MTSMTAQVFFLLGEAKNVPIVPVAALRPSKSGEAGTYRVMVMESGRPKAHEVKIGLMNRISAEVISGLNEGDIVITGIESSTGTRKTASGASRPPML